MKVLDRFFAVLVTGVAIAAIPGSASRAEQQGASHDARDAYVPLSDHRARILAKGEWLLAYRYRLAHNEGNRNSVHRETVDDVRAQGFDVVPTELHDETHLIEALWAPYDRLTLALELPVVRRVMTSVAPDDSLFKTRSLGVGDLALMARARFIRKGGEGLNVQVGFSFPSGSVTENDDTPTGKQRLPYVMQPGSGTVNFLPALSYLGRYEMASWGVDINYLLHMGENSEGWARGDVFGASGWFSLNWLGWVDTSVQIAYRVEDKLHGRDKKLDPTLQPQNDPKRQGGARLDLGPGLRIARPGRGGPALAFEASWPVYQSLNGPQIENDWQLHAGLEWLF